MLWWPFATKPERADTLEVIDLHSGAPLLYSTRSFGNTWAEGLRSLQAELPQLRHSSIECWNQVDTDVSASILANLDAGNPCRHECACDGAISAR